jgi:protein involved in polysaccharide export with SLBB domain
MDINPSKMGLNQSGPYEAIAPGTYYISSVMTGKAITVEGGSTKEGSQIVQETKNGNDSQKVSL